MSVSVSRVREVFERCTRRVNVRGAETVLPRRVSLLVGGDVSSAVGRIVARGVNVAGSEMVDSTSGLGRMGTLGSLCGM